MKKILFYIGLLFFVVQSGMAWHPHGWVYSDWPWAYENASGDWNWFRQDDVQWVHGYSPSAGWQRLNASDLTSGWIYYAWPFAYAQNDDVWYYINESDTQWVVNMRTARWSTLGRRLSAPVYAADDVTPPPGGEGLYLVIDLSDGPNATQYPVSYLDSVPAGGWTDEHKTTKLVLRRVSAGTFLRGSPADELGRTAIRESQNQVTLRNDYYIGIFEVTQKQWERVMGNWPAYFNNPDYRDTRPVEQVSYHDIRENPDNTSIRPNWPQSSQVHAESFMGRLRSRTGLNSLDLPTETQWEYAGRAGTVTALNSGYNLTDIVADTNLHELARYFHNHPGGHSSDPNVSWEGGTAQVGSYRPNNWGIYDMHGNVREYCLDWFSESNPPIDIPIGPEEGRYRTARGGAWDRSAAFCRSAYRISPPQEHRRENLGFRVARILQ